MCFLTNFSIVICHYSVTLDGNNEPFTPNVNVGVQNAVMHSRFVKGVHEWGLQWCRSVFSFASGILFTP